MWETLSLMRWASAGDGRCFITGTYQRSPPAVAGKTSAKRKEPVADYAT
jgi:hypothetical protein